MAATDSVAAVNNASPALDSVSISGVRRRLGVAAAKKPISRHDKLAWWAVLCVLTKNCLLLMGLCMFGRLIWNGMNNTPVAARDLEERVSGLESSLKKTTKMMQFQLEVLDRRITGESVEVTKYAREMVWTEMEKHAADGLGRVDYALASGGARVVRHSEAYSRKGFWGLLKGGAGVHADAQKMLRPSFGEPGQCFALRGSSGFVQLKLRMAIVPDSITLEHVAKSVAYDRSTAPKECTITAWLEWPGAAAEKVETLANFTYDLEKSNLQSFRVEPGGAVNVVRLDFSSNHGSSSTTCIYRLRVHGSEP